MLTREQLIYKLSSRKFWACVTSVLVPLLVVFNVDELTIEKVVAVVSAVGGLIAYIFTEGRIDAERAKGEANGGKAVEENTGNF